MASSLSLCGPRSLPVQIGFLEACMKKLLLIITFTAILASLAEAQQISDPRVADLVQAGKIRVGMHSFYTMDSRTGELRAVSTGIIFLDIARILGARIGVEVLPVWHPTIPEMLTCLTAVRTPAQWTGRRVCVGPRRAPRLCAKASRLTGPGGSLRGQPRRDGGTEGSNRAA